MAEKEKKNKMKIMNVFDGSVLVSDTASKHVPFILYLAFLAIIYIGNRFSSESLLRKTKALQDEIKELNSESVSTVSELMNNSKQSTVIQELRKRQMGLDESTIPPNIVNVKPEDYIGYEKQ